MKKEEYVELLSTFKLDNNSIVFDNSNDYNTFTNKIQKFLPSKKIERTHIKFKCLGCNCNSQKRFDSFKLNPFLCNSCVCSKAQKSQEVQDKIQKTILEKYGCKNAFLVKNENGVYKRDITNINRYGYSCPMKNPIKSKEIVEQKREKYGTANNFDKIKETVQNKYNVNNSFLVKNEENIEKRTITSKEKYGYDNPGQVPELKRKQMFGKYNAPNGKKYDSSWEYKFELYLIENKIDYIYQSDKTFTWYDVNGKSHEYIPDFYLTKTNEFIEIKGDHFFDKNGKFFDPYDKTEEGYKNAELKWDCMVENHVKIYTGKELKELGIL